MNEAYLYSCFSLIVTVSMKPGNVTPYRESSSCHWGSFSNIILLLFFFLSGQEIPQPNLLETLGLSEKKVLTSSKDTLLQMAHCVQKMKAKII